MIPWLRAHLPRALGGKDELLTFALQPAADAERIHIGGFEEVDPTLGRRIAFKITPDLRYSPVDTARMIVARP